MRGKRLLAALLCLLMIASVMAQQSQSSEKVAQNTRTGKISINGLVKDESGQPMLAFWHRETALWLQAVPRVRTDGFR